MIYSASFKNCSLNLSWISFRHSEPFLRHSERSEESSSRGIYGAVGSWMFRFAQHDGEVCYSEPFLRHSEHSEESLEGGASFLEILHCVQDDVGRVQDDGVVCYSVSSPRHSERSEESSSRGIYGAVGSWILRFTQDDVLTQDRKSVGMFKLVLA